MSGILDNGLSYVDALQVEQRYGTERAKRLRPEGDNQFIDISHSPQHQSFLDDPWVDPGNVQDAKTLFPNSRCQMLVLGTGLGGLVYAVRMIQAGIKPEDIRMVDVAGGVGGTWYWNRYPGAHCDIESYSYLPLLEETGYVPKHRYSRGEEIREYANLIAEKWDLSRRIAFQTKAQKLTYDENNKEWVVKLEQRQADKEPLQLDVRAEYVVTVNGPLNWPKLPGIPGILDYKGDIFHASRWNYTATGGSPDDWSLTQLKDKTVAIIGTGCTGVQITPQLARWAKHVYVVQRTPASVDHQDQKETDEKWFRNEVATSPGWQRERMKNLHEHFTTEESPSVNLMGDAWTRAPALVGLTGNVNGPKTIEELPAYMKKLHAIDLPRQNRLRKRVEEEVHDKDTAARLQAWYPSWCKRPAFHDEYLSTFNRSNVTLLDTEGKGADQITNDSVIVDGKSYVVDLIICATGFRAPFTGTPAEKANATFFGRNGVSITEEWARNGPKTQHGVLDYNFPNLFFSGPWQGANSPNYLFAVDMFARHAAYILAEARRKAHGKKFAVAPTASAAEKWSMEVAMKSAPNMAIMGCTPSYLNVEGGLDKIPPEMQLIVASSGLWGSGVEHFINLIEAWQKEGSMDGIQVEV
ncbi:FAD/NAD(P)-binding domain-containing protein [Aaosphaeria arxii CBS 175.79]|uniref:FAD/NAD(P)-binding domain-containing protein n=1 Tax=Aaosphaeria arxii CBS 175.79 TaxID=1450172 RepID=A0A6A5X847_9PLEO|nr:FAD/NAD(P)-binding domain-containing protein [Aaosphaeria arxii CBS 175.79]KAF2009123.1 FAD/NAD(P)-binding domain-containing protein [Aaosphaeria arxii CBS 175.79]